MNAIYRAIRRELRFKWRQFRYLLDPRRCQRCGRRERMYETEPCPRCGNPF